MEKIKFSQILDNFSLNIIFTIVVVLSSLLPVVFATSFIFSTYLHEKRISENQNLAIRKEVEEKLNRLVTEIASKLAIGTQSPDVIDVLLATSEVRPFIENRAYGRLSELINELPITVQWGLVSSSLKQPVFSSQNNLLDDIENIQDADGGVSLYKDAILIKEDIKLDDQNLPGPNSNIKGSVIAQIKLRDLSILIPNLKILHSISKNGGTFSFDVEVKEISTNKKKLVTLFSFIILFLLISILLGFLLFRKKVLIPLQSISKNLLGNSNSNTKNEITLLQSAISAYISNLKIQESEKAEKEKLIAANIIASQVAHDIRSPLTALNIAIDTIDKLPEDKRILVRNAIQRINDIANDLLARGKENSFSDLSIENDTKKETVATIMLSSLIDMLISEKRTQYRNKIDVQIGLELSNSYGLFSKIPANEFKRVLSNLINNSVEALENGKGKVFTTLDDNNEFIKIEIVDNGKGIPPDIIEKLGAPGVSFGKEGTTSGSGLGIHHAIKFISSIGGKIEFINNTLPETGVTVTILIPKSQPPIWFVKQVEIPLNGKLVALDDDQSIHSLWQGRLSSLKASEKNISLFSFTSAEIFKTWVLSQNLASSDTVFLVDYELLGQKTVGLDIIEELGIQKNSILVSSRYDEKNVYERCKRLGVKIIPKAMAGLVPIEIGSKAERIDAILIDDDSIVHMTWKISATQSGKKFVGFKNYNDFLKHTNEFNLSTAVVIDLHLEDGVDGSLVAQHVFNLGFKNIFIGTGKAASEVPEFPWIKGVIGKAPIWDQFE
ncbi:MAG: HAMP domain-containing histidine kinase [Bdellovibrionaceae bacterium]|nr:HAMP domain-containing histidine kinase [Pseudobdellovibrionaceae bacterium]